MAVALRVELPAGPDQASHLGSGEAALRRRQPADLDVLVGHPSEPLQYGQRLRELGLVAVVEREHERFAGGQLCAAVPVGVYPLERYSAPALPPDGAQLR